MDIEIVMKNLYESEINCSISSFWDNGWDVKLGDEMNGFVAEGNFETSWRRQPFSISRRANTSLNRCMPSGDSNTIGGKQPV